MEGRRWSTREGRVAGHCMRRAVHVRVATGGGAVVRTRLREERSWVRKGLSSGRVWWRWWEVFYRQLVARGFELRIATALSDKGVGISSVGRLRVQAGVDERHLLKDERDCIRGRNDRALLRAEVRGIMGRNMLRVGKASIR
jgi:hypothetical protein